MMGIRRARTAAAVVGAAALLAAAGCTSTDAGTTSPVATTKDATELLGTPNRATGTPITIGLVHDGKVVGIDHTPMADAFKATVRYANEYLGGINGHPIEVAECITNNVPSDATTCGIQMANDEVAALLVPTSAQDASVFKAIAGTGIPYVAYAAGSPEIITGQGAFLFVNPIATLAAPAKVAKDSGYTKAGIIVVDVPAATGSLPVIARPIYAKAGIDLNIVSISPQTADMTPQIQEAIGSGAEQFTIIGPDEFNTTAIKALEQLDFQGTIVMITAPSPAIAENIPGGLEGVVYITSATSDPNDKDVQLFNAVLESYGTKDVSPNAQSAWGFSLVIALVNALKGNASATDAASFAQALGSMPQPLPLPLGGGLTYHCGAKVVALLPNACTDNVLWTTLDEQGTGHTYEQLDVKDYMTFGG